MINVCPKVPKNNFTLKYLSYIIACFILYIIIGFIGIKKRYNLYFSYFELFVFLLFLIFGWIYLLGFLIISIFFNAIRIGFVLGILIQNQIPFYSELFKYSYYIFFILLDIITMSILFKLRKESEALLLEQNEGTELDDIPNKDYFSNKDKENNKHNAKKGYVPFSGKGTVVG